MLGRLANPNALSMVFEKAAHTLINFVVIAFVARYLGPELFGTLGLVQAIFIVGFHVAVFFSEQTVVKLTLVDDQKVNLLFGRMILIKLAASLPVYFLTVIISWYAYGDEFAVLAGVYCCMHLANVDRIFFGYFRARENGFLVLIARLGIYAPGALLKVGVVYLYSDLILLAIVFLVEGIVLSSLSYVLYAKANPIKSNGSRLQLKNLLNDEGSIHSYRRLMEVSWPIFSSALLITLYSRIDQFMIRSMMGVQELGVYTTAVKVSEASTYLVTTIIASRFPQLMRLRKIDSQKFDQEIQLLLKLSLGFTLVFFLVFLFFAEKIIVLLFGAVYAAASQPLVVHMAGTLFIYFGVICTQYLIAHDLEIYRLYRVLCGLLINVVLNLYLIPAYGLLGAAYSTVLAQGLSSVLFNALSSKTRGIFLLQIKAIFIWRRTGEAGL